MKPFVLLVALVGFGLLFEAVEGFAWSVPRLRTRWRTDVGWFFLGALVADPVVKVATALALALPLLVLGRLGPDVLAGHGPLATLPWSVQVGAVLAIGDLVGYGMHRLHHRSDLWRLHAVHHSSEHLDWLAAVRVHPLNEVVQRTPGALVLLVLGFDLGAVATIGPVFALYGILLHANVGWRFGPLRFLVASPAFHRWHHATDGAPADGCNFAGLFPVWDLLFGTFHLPEEAPAAFGVHGEKLPEGLFGQLAWPLRARGRGIRQTPA